MNEKEYNLRTNHRTGRKVLSKKSIWHCAYHPLLQRPIAVSVWVHTVNAICQHEPNLVPYYRINRRIGPRPSMIGAKFNTMKPWESYWDNNLRKFVKTEDISTIDINDRFYSRIVAEKAAAMDKINFKINTLRKNISTDLIHQDRIYDIKQKQANLVLATEYPELDDPRWQFVTDYALLKNYDLKTAAQIILVQNNSFNNQLLKTEYLRSKYYQFVLDSCEMYEITAVMQDFYRETFVYY